MSRTSDTGTCRVRIGDTGATPIGIQCVCHLCVHVTTCLIRAPALRAVRFGRVPRTSGSATLNDHLWVTKNDVAFFGSAPRTPFSFGVPTK